MARNYPEVWLGRVSKQLTSIDTAPWLEGVAEIPVEVTPLGEGTTTEQNLIHLPASDFRPEVFVNNTTYPLALEKYDDFTLTIALDKYQTAQTELSDDQVMGAAYDMIDAATGTHTTQINESKYMKALHALAPSTHVAGKLPVLATSGDDDGTGRRRLVRADLVRLKAEYDKMHVPLLGRRLVLCSDHISDLLMVDQAFEAQYYNYTTGKIANVMGFEIYEWMGNPYFDAATKTKLSFGAVPGAGQYQASVAFYTGNVGKKTGITKQYYRDSKIDPATQANTLNYRHYFICVPKRNQYMAAMVSGKV